MPEEDVSGLRPSVDVLATAVEDLGTVRRLAFFRGLWGATGALVAVAIAWSLHEVISILVLILIAMFAAAALNPLTELIVRKTRAKRSYAVAIVAVMLVLVITFVFMVLVSALRDQVLSFVNGAPDLLNRLLQNRSVRDLNNKYHVVTALQDKLKDPDLGQSLLGDIFSGGVSAAQAVASVLVVFVLSLYFLAALPQIKEGLYGFAPISRRERFRHLGDEIIRRTGRYVGGAFLVALLAGFVTAVFLVSVGLGKYALPLALLVALLDLIPLVGAILGATIVTVLCFGSSLYVGIAAAIFYLIYEIIEGYVIYPRMMRASVDMPEYATIIAVLIGGALGGIVGALLALPTMVAILLVARDVWLRRQETHSLADGTQLLS